MRVYTLYSCLIIHLFSNIYTRYLDEFYTRYQVAQWSRVCLPMQETWVWFLGQRFPEEGNGYALQYPYLGNLMDRGAWQALVHGVAIN